MWLLNCDIIYRTDGAALLLGPKSYEIVDGISCKPLFELLSAGITDSERQRLMSNESVFFIWKKLTDLDLLVFAPGYHKGDALEKSEVYFLRMGGLQKPILKKMQEKTLAILGCGGLGANLAYYLITSGINSILLVDYDTVQISNLNRQFPFAASDVGLKKVDALKVHLNDIRPEVKIVSKFLKISSAEDLAEAIPPEVDLIVCAIDDPPLISRIIVAEYALEQDIDVVFGAAGYEDVSIGPLLSGESAKSAYITELRSQTLTIDAEHTRPLAGSLPGINSIMSASIANQVLAHLCGFGKPRILGAEVRIDPYSMYVEEVQRYE